MDPVDGDQVYAAERLLNQRTRSGKSEYLVKWKGWSAKHNTWEPVENILDVRLIQEFNERQTEKPGAKRKSAVPPKEPASSTPQKRGRRSTRTKAEESASDNTSPSTSVGTRRSNRSSVTSAAEQRRKAFEMRQSEESEASGADKLRGTSEDSETPGDEVESEVETIKKPEKSSSPSAMKSNQNVDETTEGKTNDKSKSPQKGLQSESSTEDSSLSDIVQQQNAEENAMDNQKEKTASPHHEIPSSDPPVEIYVERNITTVEVNTVNENGNQEVTETVTTEKEAYVITNEDDPNCTHKIQVYTVPPSSQPSSKEPQLSEGKNGSNAAAIEGDDEDIERFEIVKTSSYFETKLWCDASSADTNGASTSSSNEPYQYNSSTIITEVKANDTTVTILEI